jgi:tRNA G18 (ribose-2'-O)-methylase SpoU
LGKDLSKVSRGKERTVKWEFKEETTEVLQKLKEEGYTLVGIEQVEGAEIYTEFTYPQKIAFVLGSEVHGMPKATAAFLDSAVVLPMFGKGGSVNVHVAFAVVAYFASLSAVK